MVHEREPWIGAANLDRRSFLKCGGSLVVAFSLRMGVAAAADFAPVPTNELDSWIAIAEDGAVTAFTGRIDLGTGTQTVYCQAIAEELDIPVESVSVVMGDTALTPEQGKSTASNSVSRTFSTGGLNRRFWGVAEARKRVGSKGRVLESSVV
jgi:hypothetical protein